MCKRVQIDLGLDENFDRDLSSMVIIDFPGSFFEIMKTISSYYTDSKKRRHENILE